MALIRKLLPATVSSCFFLLTEPDQDITNYGDGAIWKSVAHLGPVTRAAAAGEIQKCSNDSYLGRCRSSE